MVLNEVQRQIGKDNYAEAVRMTRRQMLTGTLAIPGAAAMVWGHQKLDGAPVRVGVIGTGDQGNNGHILPMNPDFCELVAFCDIRPSNIKRTWDYINQKFGAAAAKKVRFYADWKEMLEDKDIELVDIALPLHLHASVTIAALEKNKHVLCEKLMAHNITECKQMIQAADKAGKLLAVGHQRHYSYLYANCRAIIDQGSVIGDIRHIRAYWHRNQAGMGAPGAETGKYDGWFKAVPVEDKNVDLKKYGYRTLEELIRWRVHNRTGAGLVAELGSHQLDACSIFLGHVHPKAVHGSGVVSFFKDNREVDDHVFLIFEYPEKANNAVVMYSSIGTNAFDGYGEQVMGTRGTLVVQEERDAYVFKEGATKETRITWAEERVNRPVANTGSTRAWAVGVETPDTLTSRGYREQQEHMAWLIRHEKDIKWPNKENPHPENNPETAQLVPRCHGRVALADAVVALTANLAMRKSKRIEFKEAWFDPYDKSVPEDEA